MSHGHWARLGWFRQYLFPPLLLRCSRAWHALPPTLKALLDQVRLARVEYDMASQRFRTLRAIMPNGKSAPDEVFQLQQTGEASASALRRYLTALAALGEFELRGILPADWKDE